MSRSGLRRVREGVLVVSKQVGDAKEGVWWVQTQLVVNGEDAAAPSEPVVAGAVDDPADADLAESRSTHDARFDRHV